MKYLVLVTFITVLSARFSLPFLPHRPENKNNSTWNNSGFPLPLEPGPVIFPFPNNTQNISNFSLPLEPGPVIFPFPNNTQNISNFQLPLEPGPVIFPFPNNTQNISNFSLPLEPGPVILSNKTHDNTNYTYTYFHNYTNKSQNNSFVLPLEPGPVIFPFPDHTNNDTHRRIHNRTHNESHRTHDTTTNYTWNNSFPLPLEPGPVIFPFPSNESFLLSMSDATDDSYSESTAIQTVTYSIASYCSPKNLQNWNCNPCKTQVRPAELTIFYNKTGANSGYIAYTKETNTISIVFRGTLPWSIKDWIDDLDFVKTSYRYCSGCNVHKGFYESYLNLQTQLMSALTLMRNKYANAKISVTGHSLGAAIATHCAVDLFMNYGIKDFTLYTFGSPRVGDDTFQKWFTATFMNTYFRITHERDPVPHLPLEAMGFKHPVREVFYSGPKQQYKLCDPKNSEDPTCSDKYAADVNVLDHLTYLGFDFSVDILACQ